MEPFEDIFTLLDDLEKIDIPMINIEIDEDFSEMVDMGNGKFCFMPNSKSVYLYRGQTRCYSPCVPSIYRNKKFGELTLFVEKLKQIELELLLSQHPAVLDMQGQGIIVNFLGLAQHYGYKTNCLDLTASKEIAAFFACCQYKDGRYLSEANAEYGVLYRVPWVLLDPNLDGKIQIIGFQPFKRPGEQKGWGYIMDEGEDFSQCADVFYFRQTKEGSHHLFEKFKGGEILLPKDPINDYAQTIKNSKHFSRVALKKTLQVINPFGNIQTPKNVEKVLHECFGIIVVDNYPFGFDEAEIKKFGAEWANYSKLISKKIGFRLACYPSNSRRV